MSFIQRKICLMKIGRETNFQSWLLQNTNFRYFPIVIALAAPKNVNYMTTELGWIFCSYTSWSIDPPNNLFSVIFVTKHKNQCINQIVGTNHRIVAQWCTFCNSYLYVETVHRGLWTVNCDLVIWTQPSGPLCLWQCLHNVS